MIFDEPGLVLAHAEIPVLLDEFGHLAVDRLEGAVGTAVLVGEEASPAFHEYQPR